MSHFKITDKKGVKTSEIIKQLRKKFDVVFYSNEKTIDKEFPAPKKTTTRYFKKNVEADEEYKNMSANDLKEEGIEGITLRERLLMELDYFNETENHLDIENITLCSGSRFSGGSVPFVRWDSDDRRLYVYWCDTDNRGPRLRTRAVISHSSSSLKPLKQSKQEPYTCPHCNKNIIIKLEK